MNDKKSKIIAYIGFEVLLFFIAIALIVGNTVAVAYSSIISKYFGQSTYKLVDVNEDDADNDYYTSKYDSYDALLAEQKNFAKQVQGEGAVLLKNNGKLPIADSGKITLLGASIAPASSNTGLLIGGSGSGSVDTKQVPSLYKVFRDAGYDVNEVLWDYYTEGDGVGTRNGTNGTVGEQPLSKMSSVETNALTAYKDGTAVVFIGRTGSESADISFSTTEDADKHYLEFSTNELDLINKAVSTFSNVVVMLNTMNVIELGPIVDMNVSVIWVGAGGQAGLLAYPEILNGKINPSGRLTDTYAVDLLAAPSVQNTGSFSFVNSSDFAVDGGRASNYYVYAEGIYVGYRYYETRYADVVANRANVGDFDYSSEVIYPFGYGQSYTQFEYTDYKLTERTHYFEVSVTVNNVGDCDGKEVVQVYMQSPYTAYDIENGIEKSAVELVGYAKTDILKAKTGSQKVTITVPKEYMRSYDSKKAKTYIVDDGEYYFAVGADAHDALNNILVASGYTTFDGMTSAGNADLVGKYTQNILDSLTYSVGNDGERITNQFGNADIFSYNGNFKYLSRNNWTGTFPEPYGGESKTSVATSEMIANIEPDIDYDTSVSSPATGANNNITLASLIGVDYDAEQWDLLLDNLTLEEMKALIGLAGYGTELLQSINKPATVDKDGPAGISSTLIGGNAAFGYPVEEVFSATFNTDLLEKYGELISEDGLLTGTSGWYAPGVNIHRSAFGGRNFEYYSEDSFLTGSMAAALVNSVTEHGMYCYVKHFALNEQETNRNTACTFANEQSIRQIYLKGFELAVRDGNANAIMTSYNRIGTTWSGHHRGLLTEVLRNEWGFTGVALTDAQTAYYETQSVEIGLWAGQDLWLCTAKDMYTVDTTKAYNVEAMREASHRILYVVANSNAMNGMSSTTKVVPVMPAWQICLIALDVAYGAAFVVGSVFIIRKILKLKKSNE